MSGVLRQLPRRFPPVPGQSLPSYLDQIAASSYLPVPLTTILYRAGLIEDETVQSIGSAYGVALPDGLVENAAFVLRLSEERVREMLLSAYDGVAVDFSDLDPQDPHSVRRAGMREWAYLVGSHYCPACLEEDGAWRVSWKLPWSFACERHARLLHDTCPQCGRRAGNMREDLGGAPRYAAQRRTPRHCMNPPAPGVADVGVNSRPCGQDLSKVPQLDLTDAPRLLETQRHINAVLESRQSEAFGQLVPALAYFRHLRGLCAILLYAGQPSDLGDLPPPVLDAFREHADERDRRVALREVLRESGEARGGPTTAGYRGTPTRAALMAAVLPTAVDVLAAENLAGLEARFTPLVERLRERKLNAVRLAAKDFNLTGPLLRAFDAILAPKAEFDRRIGLRSNFARSGEPYRYLPGHVPQLLWEDEYAAHFAPLFNASDMHPDVARRVCSAALVRLCCYADWAAALHALALPAASIGSVNRAMGILNALQHSDAFAASLHDLAARLERSRLRADYCLRRRSLSPFTEITSEDWRVISENAAFSSGKSGGRRRNGAAWVWARVTEGDWRLAPALRGIKISTARDTYARFLSQDLYRLEEGLTAYANDLVARIDSDCPTCEVALPH